MNVTQSVARQGLRSSGNNGAFRAAAYAADGSLILLYDQGDGLRLEHADASLNALLADVRLGTAGDSGLTMALDPAGNVYVAGTSSSGQLAGTGGAPFAGPVDASANGFLAKFNTSLQLQWLSFLGAGRMAVTGVAATADSAFVTGTTYSSTLPVTASAIGQKPATGTSGNGFVERFNSGGTQLAYATYLTGVGGDTNPAAIVADAADDAYVAGETAASGYPTTAALQPRILTTTTVSASGFLTKLTPAADGYTFSTFIAGSGITGMALDHAGTSLLLTGNVSAGQFPVLTASAPVVATTYQSLLRIPLDGQSVTASTPLVPGSASVVAADPQGGAWVAGSLGLPLFPGAAMPYNPAGDGFLLHVNLGSGGTATSTSTTIDQTVRLGGLPVNNSNYASLNTAPGTPAVSSDGSAVTVPSTVTANVSAALASIQRFDLPLVGSATPALPSSLRDAAPSACIGGSQCSGTAAMATIVQPSGAAPSLALSPDGLPNLTLRNLGSATATGLALAASGFTTISTCGTTLEPSGSCAILLSGAGPGTVTISAANGGTATYTLPAATLVANNLVLSSDELDFGAVASSSGAVTRTVAITNLSGTAQSFASAQDAGPATHAYTLTETATTCGGALNSGTHTVPANASCSLTLGLAASSTATNDGAVNVAWKIGAAEVSLTGWAQSLPLAFSATELDFGVQFTNTPSLDQPRTLFVSNIGTSAQSHTTVSQPPDSPFTLTDACPQTIEPGGVCGLTVLYGQTQAPASDSTTLTLDDSLSALVTGETLAPATVTGTVANPSLSLSASSVSFATPVVVTGVSGAVETLTVHNTGSSAFALVFAINGDFAETDNCNGELTAGGSCLMQISFLPSQPGTRGGLLSVTAGTGFAPALVSLEGTAVPLLPANNGTLALGQATAGEPLVAWYRVQQAVTSLTASVPAGSGYGVALVTDTGSGHGALPADAFTQSATANCGNCWLGVQLLSNNVGAATSSLTLSTVSAGKPYTIAVSGTVAPVSGLLLTPAAADFGSVALGSTSAATTFVLANLLTPAADVTITGVAATGDFSVAASSSGMAGCSGALNATASCAVAISFAPTATGTRSGTLTVTTTGGTATAALTGYGAAAQALNLNPASVTFDNVPGSAATQGTVQVTNASASAVIFGSPSMAAGGAGSFAVSSTCTMLAPGASCALTVTFTPGANMVQSSISLPTTSTVNGQAIAATYTIPLNGNYTSGQAGLLLTPSSINFGAAADNGAGPTRQLTLANLSAKAVAVSLSLPRQFALSAPSPCATLAAGASCSFSVTFLPETAGALTGTVLANGAPADGSATLEALSYLLGYGTGSGALSVSGPIIPGTPLSFGQVASGQSVSQTLTLTNSGTGALNIRRLSSQPPFSMESTCGTTLAAGGSCTVTLTYAPVYEIATGTTSFLPRNDTGALVIESDAASSPDTVALSGIAAPLTSGSPATAGSLEAFTLSNSALTFANTQVGNVSATQTLTLLNNGSTTLHFGAITAPTDFAETNTCATLLSGSTCTIAVTFTPGDALTSNLRSGTLEIASDASTALEFVTLVGSSAAAPLTLTPSALNFGTVNVGRNDALSVTVANTSSVPVTLTSFTAGGDYSVVAGSCALNTALPAGTSCTLNVSFAPKATGTRTGTLSVGSDATQVPLTVALTGVGAAAHLVVTPGALAFGSISTAAQSTLLLTLQNTGSVAVRGLTNTITGSDASLFAVTAPCPTPTLAAGATCTEQVTFTPGNVGSRSATLSIASSDPSSPAVIPLTGMGVTTGGGGTSPGTGSFTLTVNGGSSATLTVSSGSPATYSLSVTPTGGFTGIVALTCTPVGVIQYASCSLLYPQLNIVAGAQNSTATVNTITTGSSGWRMPLGLLLLLPLGKLMRRRYRSRLRRLTTLGAFTLAATLWVGLAGCGGGAGPIGVYETPPGSYQYQVTASSTTGTVISSAVTLNLVVK